MMDIIKSKGIISFFVLVVAIAFVSTNKINAMNNVNNNDNNIIILNENL